mmetsp:Transcript_20008/g.22267  ORF Transcript_20008/g.22267 Transcript_20008/m.22267 type:complete len:82 (+) Transcript_20008:550-795(+)
MAEGEPPLSSIHPMRALFFILKNPPPTLSSVELWTSNFHSFLRHCLQKKPDDRLSARQALNHRFIGLNKHAGTQCLMELIQ